MLQTVIGAMLGELATVIGAYFASKIQLAGQLRLQTLQNQQQVLSRLMGRKFVTSQLYVSRYEALLFSDYHEARWKLAGAPSDSIDLREAQRWMHRSEDLVFEFTKSHQALFEDLGLVLTLFPASKTLDEIVQRIYSFKAIKTAAAPAGATVDQLLKWKDEAVRQLQNLVDREYGQAIKELIEYLQKELRISGA
ncbi:MAG: hypothetical protein ACREX3_13175 [Gammaproteobacteria bacterium]